MMVARGDLGIEVPLEQVPVEQKRLIRAAGRASKPTITATQMLASMVTARRPTRAEVTDVANAIYDGTDAIMLSEETAVGENPVEAVRVMDRIARATEPDLRYGEWLFSRTDQATQDVADSVAQSAVGAVYRLGLKALVVPTTSGRTARILSAHRPNVPVLALSPRLETVRRLSLLFGVTAVQSPPNEDIRALLEHCAAIALNHCIAHSGELIGITAGLPDQELGTNLFEVHRVP
jgi:pyruvate kinase